MSELLLMDKLSSMSELLLMSKLSLMGELQFAPTEHNV